MVADLGWVDLDFEFSTVCPILPWLMGIQQKGLGKWARWWNTEIQDSPTQVRDQMCHPVTLISLTNHENKIETQKEAQSDAPCRCPCIPKCCPEGHVLEVATKVARWR